MAVPFRSQRTACFLVLGSALLVNACRVQAPAGNEAAAAHNATAPAPPSAQPVLPTPAPPLDREALLLAVIKARSAAAAGSDDKAAQDALDGARFQLRIAIGCRIGSPDQPAANFGATFDAGKRRVSLSAAPDLSLEDAAVAALAGDKFESAEGFWIPDPWLLAPACLAGGAAQPAPVDRSVGIAQFYTKADSRLERRDGRAYEAREELAEGTEPPQPGSWQLVVTGRLRRLEGGAVISCRPAADRPMPSCIVSVELEQVAIEKSDGKRLAEWGRG